jgi:hypothetical protein
MCEMFSWDGSAWDPLGAGMAICSGGVCTRTRNNITSFSSFGVGSNLSLPLTLLSFKADLLPDNTVALKWTTTDEVNNLGFSIERGSGTGDWSDIGWVDGRNASGVHQYAFLDAFPGRSVNFYRLMQWDIDGTKSMSSIVKVIVKEQAIWEVGPNPVVNGQLMIRSVAESDTEVRICDIHGRLLHSTTIAAGEPLTIVDITTLPAGAFFVKLSNGDDDVVKKMMKM